MRRIAKYAILLTLVVGFGVGGAVVLTADAKTSDIRVLDDKDRHVAKEKKADVDIGEPRHFYKRHHLQRERLAGRKPGKTREAPRHPRLKRVTLTLTGPNGKELFARKVDQNQLRRVHAFLKEHRARKAKGFGGKQVPKKIPQKAVPRHFTLTASGPKGNVMLTMKIGKPMAHRLKTLMRKMEEANLTMTVAGPKGKIVFTRRITPKQLRRMRAAFRHRAAGPGRFQRGPDGWRRPLPQHNGGRRADAPQLRKRIEMLEMELKMLRLEEEIQKLKRRLHGKGTPRGQ